MFDADYLIKREQQELEAARRASDVRARRLHLEMADAYTFRVSELKRQERLNHGFRQWRGSPQALNRAR
jgi:hypothetical protein